MLVLNKICKDVESEEGVQRILDDVTLSIGANEFVAIIGQSGSGKSTLLNILGCLDVPSSGRYEVGGKDTDQLSADELAELRRDYFGFVFQRYNLLNTLTALDNVALPAIYAGVPRENRMARALQLLETLELGEKQGSIPNKMSGGQQQRVSIARALMNGGPIILADEPTGALDTKSGANVMKILKDLHSQGHTVILVTHDPAIASHANRVIEISDGKIIADESKRSASSQAPSKADTPKREFIGKSLLFEAFSMAINSIYTHKLRSILTTLGIIIGVASVVGVIALGEGAQRKVIEDINAMGTNTIRIFPGKGFGDLDASKVKTLSLADAQALAGQPYVDSASPNVSGQGVATHRNRSASAQMEGVGAQYFAATGVKIVTGNFFTEYDVRETASVVVIDTTARDAIFQNRAAIGEIMLLNGYPLRVIGIADKTDKMFSAGDSITLWVPYSTAMHKILGTSDINYVTVRVSDHVNPQVADKNIDLFLTSRHGRKDFFTFNSDSIRQTVEKTTGTLALLVSGIAFISLAVGGIGVMNIMLVSVTERTAEIGIRMAVGAKRVHILSQFLIEAVILCLLGGLTGVLFAFGLGLGIQTLSKNIPLIFSASAVLLAVFCSMLIGIIFGWVPARNASRLSPVQALLRD